MERHTPCARSLHGPVTQTDGRFCTTGSSASWSQRASGSGIENNRKPPQMVGARAQGAEDGWRSRTDGGVNESLYWADIPDCGAVGVSFEDEGNRRCSCQLGYRTFANRGRSTQVPE